MFEIVELEELSGRQAHIYSVSVDNENDTLLDQFFEENKQYKEELEKIYVRIKVMADDTGCRREFFKEGEGKLADGVMTLSVGRLRLYGIYFNKTVVLFGSGGYKPEGIRAYQEDPFLNSKVKQVKCIAEKINKGICEGNIKIKKDGTIDYENFEDYE